VNTILITAALQSESNIIQSLYRALKKSPATHKLGAIYVIDSVVRRWIEQAKSSGQDLNIDGRGEPGTYPAAIKRVTELMPALFDDTLKGIPAEQKDKLGSMVGIWEKGNTFPAKMLADFRTKLSGPNGQATVQTNGTVPASSAPSRSVGERFMAPVPSRPMHTPVGYPPQHLYDQGLIIRKDGPSTTTKPDMMNGSSNQQGQAAAPQQPQQAPSAPSDVNSILAALANTAAKPPPQQTAPPPPQPQQQSSAPPLPPQIAALFQQQNGAQPPTMLRSCPLLLACSIHRRTTLSITYPNFPGFQPPQPPPSVPQQYQPVPPPQIPPPQQADPLGPLRHILPQSILGDQQKLVQALKVLQDLQTSGIPMEHWGPVVAAFDQQKSGPPQSENATYGGQNGSSRGRSRSPDRGRRRGSPTYGNYGSENYNGARGSTQSDQRQYRQRSPIRDSPVPVQPSSHTAMNGQPMQLKYIGSDPGLPPDTIKVLSRTLFVGGANGSQQEIQQLFERFGKVQTCIANRDKRHAFVKMTTRSHALNAKAGMERLQSTNDRETMNIARQTKWGVGFGPRECCDYAKGESIIPIHKLTDADMKWLLTAEYGGTGGSKVEGGMVLEEPDIEIGAGVSSKAMSKRVLPEVGGQQAGNKRQRDDGGPRKDQRQQQQRERPNEGGYGYSGVSGQPTQMESYGYLRSEPVNVATPPQVPGFGFGLPAGPPNYR